MYCNTYWSPRVMILSYNQVMKVVVVMSLVMVLALATPPSQEEQYMSMRRTACLVLSRYHLNTQSTLIESTIKSLPPDTQQPYINKLYVVGIEACEREISPSQVQSFYIKGDEEFDPTPLFRFLDGIDYSALVSDLQLNRAQEQIVKFVKKYDEEEAIRRQEKQAEEEEKSTDQGYQMKVLGISMNEIPSSVKLIYVLVFLSLIGGALYYGFTQVTKKKEKGDKKRRKSPTRDTAQKKQ